MAPLTLRHPGLRRAFADHSRLWRDFQYVYPVISRRSEGLSIGINLNIDKACNFDCVYCCVDRSVPPPRKDVDLTQVGQELERLLHLIASGVIWDEPPFAGVTDGYRVLRDIAFSGDGEPTMFSRLDRACEMVARAKLALDLHKVKIVLITNGTGLSRTVTKHALRTLDQNNGEVWVKLDAGDEEYYRNIDVTAYPYKKILANILACGRDRPIVIQSLFLRSYGESPAQERFDAYLDRLHELLHNGCRIQGVQLYTLARAAHRSEVAPLPEEELSRLAERLRARLPGLGVKIYPGVEGNR